jgi:hypothetical protein
MGDFFQYSFDSKLFKKSDELPGRRELLSQKNNPMG